MQRQRTLGMRLGQALLLDGRLTPELLADTIAEQADLPRVARDTGPVKSLAGAIPADFIRRHEVVPFARAAGDTLQVAVASRPDATVTQRLRAVTGMHVAYVVACDHELAAWVAAAAPEDVLEPGHP